MSKIKIKSSEQIKVLKEGGIILKSIMDELEKKIEPGVNTGFLEKLACRLMQKAGGRPAFKNFPMGGKKIFPTALCTSINNEVVHGPALPSRKLREGDIIGIDMGMEYPLNSGINKYSKLGGMYTDMARTFAVGKIDERTQKLMDVTRKSLDLATSIIKPGVSLDEIGTVIQNHVEEKGFSVVRDLVGHGVGFEVHEDPQIPHYRIRESDLPNVKLREGMVIAIEPMVNMGDWEVVIGKDGMTVLTYDGSLSAHFENTFAVLNDGVLIITE